MTGRGAILIDRLAPALFSADGSGGGAPLGAAVLTHPDGTQSVTPLNQPVPFGQAGDVVTLVLYATGMRGVDSQDHVAIYVGSTRLPVLYAGPQPAYTALDQINVTLPSTLHGAGPLALRTVVEGLSSNTVTVTLN